MSPPWIWGVAPHSYVGCGDGGGGVGQVAIADLFADHHDDALPVDDGTKSEHDRHGDLDPDRDEACRAVEFGRVGVENGDLLLAKGVLIVLRRTSIR